MSKKLVTVLFAVPAVVVMLAGAASAHVPTVQADCRTMSVDLVAYEKGSTVQIEVGDAAQSYKFDSSFHKAYPWDPTVAHQWKVIVDNKGDGVHDQWDQTFTGTTTPCVPSTKPAVINVDLTPPTTAPVVNPPKVEYFNPTPPVCVLDGRYNANSPECGAVDAAAVTPPADTPKVLAFTGPSHAQSLAVTALALLGAGFGIVLAGRRFGHTV